MCWELTVGWGEAVNLGGDVRDLSRSTPLQQSLNGKETKSRREEVEEQVKKRMEMCFYNKNKTLNKNEAKNL